jgi:hypothetical protein
MRSTLALALLLAGGCVDHQFMLRTRDAEGTWTSSVRPVRADVGASQVTVDYSPRRATPATVSASRDSVCELRVRRRPNHDLGWGGVVAGITAGTFVGQLSRSDDRGARTAGAITAVAASALLITGVTMLLWPQGRGESLLEQDCSALSRN